MSILIKGMEMPTSCEMCPFLDYEEGFCFASGVRGKSGWYEFTWCPGGIKNGRPDDCPLVPVPPHGRLIDADAFERRCMFDSNIEDMQDVIYALRDYPTIIPAEKEDDNGERERRHLVLCLTGKPVSQ